MTDSEEHLLDTVHNGPKITWGPRLKCSNPEITHLYVFCAHEPGLVRKDLVDVTQVLQLARQELDALQPLLLPMILEELSLLHCDLCNRDRSIKLVWKTGFRLWGGG